MNFKPLFLLTLAIVVLSGLSSCQYFNDSEFRKPAGFWDDYRNTTASWENGAIVKKRNPAGSNSFLRIELASWKNVPVISEKLPAVEDAIRNGSVNTTNFEPCHMQLPRLAYYSQYTTANDLVFDLRSGKMVYKQIYKPGIVVVVQMFRSLTDTVVGFRYLDGGSGGSLIGNFRFLTTGEAALAVKTWKNAQRADKGC